MKKQIPNSSNSLLFHKSYIHSKIPTDYPQNPWGFITVPIPIPYPYPWESPWESPYPRQPCRVPTLISEAVRRTGSSCCHNGGTLSISEIQNVVICHTATHQVRFSTPKCAETRFRLGRRHGPRWGSVWRSPRLCLIGIPPRRIWRLDLGASIDSAATSVSTN